MSSIIYTYNTWTNYTYIKTPKPKSKQLFDLIFLSLKMLINWKPAEQNIDQQTGTHTTTNLLRIDLVHCKSASLICNKIDTIWQYKIFTITITANLFATKNSHQMCDFWFNLRVEKMVFSPQHMSSHGKYWNFTMYLTRVCFVSFRHKLLKIAQPFCFSPHDVTKKGAEKDN